MWQMECFALLLLLLLLSPIKCAFEASWVGLRLLYGEASSRAPGFVGVLRLAHAE
jgi:hypothetical protein